MEMKETKWKKLKVCYIYIQKFGMASKILVYTTNTLAYICTLCMQFVAPGMVCVLLLLFFKLVHKYKTVEQN